MKIVHISDIHWRGLSRHEEYTEVFTNAFHYIAKMKPDCIFIGGDIFHTKTSGISPEVIDRMVWMFKGLSAIAKTHIILGNHDGNLANEDRQDAISPLVVAMQNPNLCLYKDSGVFPIGNGVSLSVFSCFDKDNWSKVKPNPHAEINIAAFHGSVGGIVMDNGWSMPAGKAEAEIEMFDGFDFTLLGDIHKCQYLAERPDFEGVMKKHIAYPGSLIQQNFGEDQDKGFLVWDIKSKSDWNVEFFRLPNRFKFITVPWQNDIQSTFEAVEKQLLFSSAPRVRVTSDFSLSASEQKQLSDKFKRELRVTEVVFKSKSVSRYDVALPDGTFTTKASLRNNPAAIKGFYKEFLRLNDKKYYLTPSEEEDGMALIIQNMTKLNSVDTETKRDVQWSLKKFSFDNLHQYGEDNEINFEDSSGVVGVFGKNKVGKSSLIGALMYVLFNSSDREGISKNGQIMNQTKNTCKGTVTVTVDNVDYVIERSSSRAEISKKGKQEFDPEKTETKLNFSRVNSDGTRTELNGITRDETDKEIRRLLGSPNDFLMTSVATQRRMEAFIDEGATSRKVILNRFLDLEIFEKLHGYIKEHLASLTSLHAAWASKSPISVIECEAEIQLIKANAAVDEEKVKCLSAELELIQQWITDNRRGVDAAFLVKKLAPLDQKILAARKQLEAMNIDGQELITTIKKATTFLEALKAEADAVDVKALRESINKVNKLEISLRDKTSLVKHWEKEIESKEKSIKKLSLVPCGDQFTSCLYIKDSHEDKKGYEASKDQLTKMMLDLAEMTTDLKEFQQEQFADKLFRHEKTLTTIKENEKLLKERQSRLSMLRSHKEESMARLELLEAEKAELEGQLKGKEFIDVQAKEEELRNVQSFLRKAENAKTSNLIALGRAEEKLTQAIRAEECKASLSKDIRIATSVLGAFHRNGIPAIVLKTQLPALNAEVDRLLSGIVDFTIQFETESGSNVMDVFIQDANSKRILELGSGMEKMIASIAIRVALINLSNLSKSDIFVIDEGFNALDEYHVGKCLELLQSLRGQFKNILLISHMDRVKESADKIIHIVSNGTDSKIQS